MKYESLGSTPMNVIPASNWRSWMARMGLAKVLQAKRASTIDVAEVFMFKGSGKRLFDLNMPCAVCEV